MTPVRIRWLVHRDPTVCNGRPYYRVCIRAKAADDPAHQPVEPALRAVACQCGIDLRVYGNAALMECQ